MVQKCTGLCHQQYLRVSLDHSGAHDILLLSLVSDIDLRLHAKGLIIEHVLILARHFEAVAPIKEITRCWVAAGLGFRLVSLLLLLLQACHLEWLAELVYVLPRALPTGHVLAIGTEFAHLFALERLRVLLLLLLLRVRLHLGLLRLAEL